MADIDKERVERLSVQLKDQNLATRVALGLLLEMVSKILDRQNDLEIELENIVDKLGRM